MRHVEVFPAGPLFPIVKKYLINYSTPPSEYVLPVVASGAYLIYAHAETADLKYKHYTEKVMTCFGVGGNICKEQMQVHCSGYVEFIFVELHPVALYHLYKNPLRTFTDRFTPIDAAAENEHTDRILNASDIHAKLSLVRGFLETHLPVHQIMKDNVYCLTQWVEQRGGQVSVAEMARLLGLGERQVERVFLEKMGVSPKYYTKMVQMRQAVNLVMGKGDKLLTDVLYEKGHYDAAHFNKDFKRFIKINPKQFLQEDSPFLKRLLQEETE